MFVLERSDAGEDGINRLLIDIATENDPLALLFRVGEIKLRAAGLDFVRDPMGAPQIPNWSRVLSAMPDFLEDLATAVETDAAEAARA